MFKSNETLRLIAGLVVGATLMVSGTAHGAAGTSGDACVQAGTPYSALTVVLVDRTDVPTDPAKLDQFMGRVEAMVKQGEIQPGERVILATVRGRSNDSEVLVDRVRPMEGWTSVKREVMLGKRRLAECLERNGKAFALTPTTEKFSPILETLQFAVSPLLGGKPGMARRLIVFSDMAQNGEQLSFYRKGGDLTPQQTLETTRREKLIPAMRGVAVYVTGTGGTMPEEQARRAAEFWKLYFEASGATLRFYSANTSF